MNFFFQFSCSLLLQILLYSHRLHDRLLSKILADLKYVIEQHVQDNIQWHLFKILKYSMGTDFTSVCSVNQNLVSLAQS